MEDSSTPVPEQEHTGVSARMREDWNARAREDAGFYVAFGRRNSSTDAEFFATATDVINGLETELRRVPMAERHGWRALEIGCGPGRLMRPMSRHFGEIHGIDVSDEMIAQARHKLRDIAHAHLHRATGSDLALFPADYFDFVYSYAVFQHIPSADVIYSYFREIVRVLKPGGLARLQIDGRPKFARPSTTWDGVQIGGGEVRRFTAGHGMRLLALTGVDTQYMWTTWQKPPACSIRHVVNAFTGERVIPASGHLAAANIWIRNLPSACDLNSLTAFVDGIPATGCHVSPAVSGISQLQIVFPAGVRTGLVPVRVEWRGEPLCPDTVVRVIPPGPAVPRLMSVSDGVNLRSTRIESGIVKAEIEEVPSIHTLSASLDGAPIEQIEAVCADPLASRYEVNFHLPAGVTPGGHVLEIRLGARTLTRTGIEVA